MAWHQDKSYLSEDTVQDMRAQRLDEQAFKRTLTRVNAKDHSAEEGHRAGVAQEQAAEAAPAHPILKELQRLDGFDLPVEATQTDIENALRQQQEEYQLRMGLTPGAKFNPTPQGGFGH